MTARALLSWRERDAIVRRSRLIIEWVNPDLGHVVLDPDFDVIAAKGLSYPGAEQFVITEQLRREAEGAGA